MTRALDIARLAIVLPLVAIASLIGFGRWLWRTRPETRRHAREKRLRDLGFEDFTDAQRREFLNEAMRP